MCVTGVSDNQGNTFLLSRLMTSKFPAVVVLAEMAEQQRYHSVDLQLDWAPRDQNIPADALTNEEFGDFDPAKRIKVVVEELEFRVLHRMFALAEDLYQQTQQARAAGPPPAPRQQGPRKKLRETAPWGA